MIETVPEGLQKLALAGPASGESDRERLLPEIVEEYRARLRHPLGPVAVTVDGKPYPTLLDAFADPSASFEHFSLDFSGASPGGPGWEFLPPVRRLEVEADGGAELRPPGDSAATPRRAMVRVLLREHFPPGSALPRPEAGGDGVPTWPTFARQLRELGIAPFQIALLLYLSEDRHRLEIDLLGNQLLPDRRTGRLPVSRRVQRSPRLAHGVDAWVAKGAIALTNARALEVLSETHGLTDVEMAHVLGGVREMGRSALEALKSRQLATFDGRVGLYRPKLEAFLPTADRLRRADAPSRAAAMPDPALRTSVSELLAAADARATCPLCGDVLPANHPGILCDRCQAEIGRSG